MVSHSQVLARKWRPKNFGELTGQEHVIRALTNALEQNRLHHAYLLSGTRGVGKTTIARIFAKALNCETGVTATPCGACSACTSIDHGQFIDLIELDAASNTQVDHMRELLENALYAPTGARYKIYIIDEVHMLSKSAFNAMLKTLEEPPAHVKFVLATTDPQKIPVTVLSRCLQFNLKQIPSTQIVKHLKHILVQEQVNSDSASLQLLARAAQGSMRDALSILDQAIVFGQGKVDETIVREMLGAIDQNYLYDLLDALAQNDGAKLISIADIMEARSLEFDTALQDLAALLHRIALAQTVPQAIGEEVLERERIMSLAQSFAPDDIQLFYQIALHGRNDLSLAPDEYAGFTMTLMRMLTFIPENENNGGGIEGRGDDSPHLQDKEKGRSAPATSPEKTVVLHKNPSLNQSSLDWSSLIDQLNLKGMTKMLAQHSEVRTFSADKIELFVPEMHKHLLDNKYQDKIREAIEAYFDKPVELKFSVGTGSGQTPMALQQQKEQARQSAAVAAIETDPVVKQLVEDFDAKIIDSSIKPIN
ncbi:MAG: hypothetical protein NMNS01_21010 [Nitrosomonas sp.]|jgi:DNA polymerase III subunit gamma/tau|nr:MAG: hypothetical protein NMNS01_21010 [Nitrosomonas sp.]